MADETKATKERKSIALDVFPNWKGERQPRDYDISYQTDDKPPKTVKSGAKFTGLLPVPQTNEEWLTTYGITQAEANRHAVKEISFARDTDFGNLIRDDYKNGRLKIDIEDTSAYSKACEDELKTVKERKGGAKSEEKVIGAKMKASGVTAEMTDDPEFNKLVKQYAERKAKANIKK
jgi:hypothetical protein